MRTVINAQLEAFRRDDANAAYSLAAPEIRSLFRTPGEFMRMVRTGYKAVYRPRSVRFLHHFMVAGQPVQPLEIVTAEDRADRSLLRDAASARRLLEDRGLLSERCRGYLGLMPPLRLYLLLGPP